MKPSEIPKKQACPIISYSLAEKLLSIVTQDHDELRESFYSSSISKELVEILFEFIILLDIINQLSISPLIHSTDIYKGVMVPRFEIS